MATFTSVSYASANEGGTLTYSWSTFKLRANESTDVTAFRLTSINSTDYNIFTSGGTYEFYSSGGSLYYKVGGGTGILIEKLWWQSTGFFIQDATHPAGSLLAVPSSTTLTLNTKNPDFFGTSFFFYSVAATAIDGTETTTPVGAGCIWSNINDPTLGKVTLSGTYGVGNFLVASNNITDVDSTGGAPSSVSYKWQNSPDGSTWTDIVGATNQIAYTIQATDAGKYVRAVGYFTDGGGTVVQMPSAYLPVTYRPMFHGVNF